jgi:hypothetical protein
VSTLRDSAVVRLTELTHRGRGTTTHRKDPDTSGPQGRRQLKRGGRESTANLSVLATHAGRGPPNTSIRVYVKLGHYRAAQCGPQFGHMGNLCWPTAPVIHVGCVGVGPNSRLGTRKGRSDA